MRHARLELVFVISIESSFSSLEIFYLKVPGDCDLLRKNLNCLLQKSDANFTMINCKI